MPNLNDDQLVNLLQESLPEDLSAEDIEALKAAIHRSPAVREALTEELLLEESIATHHAPPADRARKALDRARRVEKAEEQGPGLRKATWVFVAAGVVVALGVVVAVVWWPDDGGVDPPTGPVQTPDPGVVVSPTPDGGTDDTEDRDVPSPDPTTQPAEDDAADAADTADESGPVGMIPLGPGLYVDRRTTGTAGPIGGFTSLLEPLKGSKTSDRTARSVRVSGPFRSAGRCVTARCSASSLT